MRLRKPHVEGDMGKFKSQIHLSEGDFLLNACVLLRYKNIKVTLDPLLSFTLLRD